MNYEGNTSNLPQQGDSTSAYFEFVREDEYARCTLKGDWSVENNSGFEVRKEWA